MDPKRLFLPLLCFLCLSLAGHAQEDSLRTNRYVMRATLYGAGYTNLLETYLSPMEYTGTELRFMRESMRMTRLLDGNVSRQTLFQANLSLTENRAGTGSEISFLANWNYAWHYRIPVSKALKLLAGPCIDLNGGMVYNLRNSNNPVQAKAYINLGASALLIYRFRIGNYPLVARYQANIPLAGIMFSPEYGQPYYEMSISHDWGKNICFTSLHNQPSLRQLLTIDFPAGSTNLRIGYVCDLQQATVNHLKSHAWSHAMLVGIVKNFCLLKGKNQVAMPARYSSY